MFTASLKPIKYILMLYQSACMFEKLTHVDQLLKTF